MSKKSKGDKNMKEFTVYTRRIAYELRLKGFRILRTEINPKHPQFECWIFEKSPELLAAFEELARK